MNSKFFPRLRSDMTGFLLIATVSLCVGLVINQFRDAPLPLIYEAKAARLDKAVASIAAAPVHKVELKEKDAVSLPARLSLDEFKVFVEQKQGLVLDARPEIFHRLGHVPGAIAMPRDDFEAYYRKYQATLEADKSQTLVIYCTGGDCEDSELVESALRKLGFTQICLFPGGWNEWTKAELPEENNQ